jgi:hypothetical protein
LIQLKKWHEFHTYNSAGYAFQDFMRFARVVDRDAGVLYRVPEALHFGSIALSHW